MTQPTSHDQKFKNLILDYPRQALELFATQEATDLLPDVHITPIRQEQPTQHESPEHRQG